MPVLDRRTTKGCAMKNAYQGSGINRDFKRLHSVLDDARRHLSGSLAKVETPGQQGIILGQIMEINLRMQRVLDLPFNRRSKLGSRITALQSRRTAVLRAMKETSNVGVFLRASNGFLTEVDQVLDAAREDG
jgi:hypothetical protein